MIGVRLYVVIDLILSGESLGSWVDDERGKTRELMWIADTLNIDILNAHCGIRNS